MAKPGPIVMVEDDVDFHFLFERILGKLNIKNEVRFFMDGKAALEFLHDPTTEPAVIFCDINMPIMNGFEFRSAIIEDRDLRAKCIPFIFLSTSVRDAEVKRAYDMAAHGFFGKGNTLEELTTTLTLVLAYWDKCVTPQA
jgi:CheY-like chemotaxis protein